MENIKLTLTEEEANLILKLLAKHPFELVSGLIFKIQAQGVQQLNDLKDSKPEKKLLNENT